MIFKAIISDFSATAKIQDVLNAANAGAVCRPALPNHMDVVNVENAGAFFHLLTHILVGIPNGKGAF
ncbi:hypothetical protein [Methyloglobulus sp.]|uniref:hypothetical protein n=1 Tax=Methyloglobulus sp. TaxID=2518622 RepID=UPI00398A3AB6